MSGTYGRTTLVFGASTRLFGVPTSRLSFEGCPGLEEPASVSSGTRSASRNILAVRVGQRKHYREGHTLPDADLVVMVGSLRREIDQHYDGQRPCVRTSSTVNALQIERGAVSMRIVALSNGHFAVYPSGQRPKRAHSLDEVLDTILDLIGEE